MSLLGKNIPILTIEEACLHGGFGSAVLEFAHDNGYHSALIDRMGIPDRFIEHGSVDKLLEEIGLTKEDCCKKYSYNDSIKTKKGVTNERKKRKSRCTISRTRS